jgi:hypothetical protein
MAMGLMSWSMKKDRQLIKLGAGRSAEKLAELLDAKPSQVIKAARRLGVPLSPKPIFVDRRRKVKPQG